MKSISDVTKVAGWIFVDTLAGVQTSQFKCQPPQNHCS